MVWRIFQNKANVVNSNSQESNHSINEFYLDQLHDYSIMKMLLIYSVVHMINQLNALIFRIWNLILFLNWIIHSMIISLFIIVFLFLLRKTYSMLVSVMGINLFFSIHYSEILTIDIRDSSIQACFQAHPKKVNTVLLSLFIINRLIFILMVLPCVLLL